MSEENTQYNHTKSSAIRLPLLLAIALSVGILIGLFINKQENVEASGQVNKQAQKFKEIISYINEYYVDTVNIEQITETGIVQMLQQLDPHTTYLPADETELINSPLKSGFEGVGIEFMIFKDTVNIIAVIAGGPSEAIGIMAGDKIVSVDDTVVAGVNISSKQVVEKLRGEKGSKVKIGIKRKKSPEILFYTVTRAKIPTYSIETSYMIDEQTGYIKLIRFAANTYDEFFEALIFLKKNGMKRLILDLRNNGGGYLDKAIDIADEFLDGKKLIVYTDGKGERYDESFYAEKDGEFETGELIVLINENSASASEILAGALQDNDRAIVVGRKSFGKGLVQRPFTLKDQSELRLTISRYYTPSGRSIQKPYTAYQTHTDEIDENLPTPISDPHSDTLQFKTNNGRIVYGGGGITPDIIVQIDTSLHSYYLKELYANGLLREFAFQYSNDNMEVIRKMTLKQFQESFVITDKILNEFVAFCNQNIEFISADYQKSLPIIKVHLKAFIARSIWKQEGFYKVYNQSDETYLKALQLFGQTDKFLKKQSQSR